MLGFYSNNVKKELFGAPLGSNTGCSNSNPNKKVKDYSYNPLDHMGKGFFRLSCTKVRTTAQVTNFFGMFPCCSITWYKLILDETVAIKAIDMKGVKDAISEMLDC